MSRRRSGPPARASPPQPRETVADLCQLRPSGPPRDCAHRESPSSIPALVGMSTPEHRKFALIILGSAADPRRATTLWSSQVVGRPENYLTGLSFTRGGYIRMGNAVPRGSGGFTVWRSGHWAFENTDLRYGDLFGTPSAIAAYEVDGCEWTLSMRDGLPVPTGADG